VALFATPESTVTANRIAVTSSAALTSRLPETRQHVVAMSSLLRAELPAA
jgi:hypothetical protein